MIQATGGTGALAQFSEGEFDLVVTDYGMPGMNGLQLREAIRKIRPRQPVILASGFRELHPDASPLPADTVRKPVSKGDLRRATTRAIRSVGAGAILSSEAVPLMDGAGARH